MPVYSGGCFRNSALLPVGGCMAAGASDIGSRHTVRSSDRPAEKGERGDGRYLCYFCSDCFFFDAVIWNFLIFKYSHPFQRTLTQNLQVLSIKKKSGRTAICIISKQNIKRCWYMQTQMRFQSDPRQRCTDH